MTYGIPYTLTTDLGDLRVETVHLEHAVHVPDGFLAVVAKGGPVMLVPEAALTAVDTTPPEPEPGAWLIGEFIAVRFAVDETWIITSDHDIEWEHVWQQCGGPGITPRRLVAEAAPVELPWEYTDADGDTVRVERILEPNPGDAYVRTGSLGANAPATLLAAALLTAARAAREVAP